MEVTLDWKAFIFVLSCLSSNNPLSMVYEILWDYFVPDDSSNDFIFFNVCGHIVHGHVPPSISHLLATLQSLILQKQMGDIWPIMIKEVIYQVVVFTLATQFKDTFAEHFSPH
jgi:hypothetical protein